MTAASAKPGGGCVVADSLVLMLPCFWSDDRLWPCMICERGAEERRTVQTTRVAEPFSSPCTATRKPAMETFLYMLVSQEEYDEIYKNATELTYCT